jgi:hypothetical protein
MSTATDGVAIAALSLAGAEVFKVYRETAPSLADLRRAAPFDYTTSQLVLDADMLGAIMVLTIGGGVAIVTRKLYPLLFGAIGLLLISGYYRSVLRSTNEGMRKA